MRIVIIGGGPGGYEAALVAADYDAHVVLVAKEGLGGNSVLWDCVPSKALIVSADAMGWMQSAHRLGIALPHGQLHAESTVDMAMVLERVAQLARNPTARCCRRALPARPARSARRGLLRPAPPHSLRARRR